MLSRSARLLLKAPLALCALLVGCAVPVDAATTAAEGTTEGETTATVHGFLSVEQSAPWGQESEGTRQTAAATFLRVREGTDPQVVARLVGAAVDLPAPGQCRVEGQGDSVSVPLRMLNPVEMVPAGEVVVRAGESATRLVARAYPDVAHLVSGVLYTSSGREQPVRPVAGANAVTFEVAGGDDVPGFEVSVQAPSPVEQLRVERDEDARDGALTVSWQAPSEASGVPANVGVVEGDDRFFVDLVFNAGPGMAGDTAGEASAHAPRTVRCGGESVATVAVPVALRGDRSLASATVHRMRTIRLTTPALAGGQVRVDVLRLLSLANTQRGDEATR